MSHNFTPQLLPIHNIKRRQIQFFTRFMAGIDEDDEFSQQDPSTPDNLFVSTTSPTLITLLPIPTNFDSKNLYSNNISSNGRLIGYNNDIYGIVDKNEKKKKLKKDSQNFEKNFVEDNNFGKISSNFHDNNNNNSTSPQPIFILANSSLASDTCTLNDQYGDYSSLNQSNHYNNSMTAQKNDKNDKNDKNLKKTTIIPNFPNLFPSQQQPQKNQPQYHQQPKLVYDIGDYHSNTHHIGHYYPNGTHNHNNHHSDYYNLGNHHNHRQDYYNSNNHHNHHVSYYNSNNTNINYQNNHYSGNNYQNNHYSGHFNNDLFMKNNFSTRSTPVYTPKRLPSPVYTTQRLPSPLLTPPNHNQLPILPIAPRLTTNASSSQSSQPQSPQSPQPQSPQSPQSAQSQSMQSPQSAQSMQSPQPQQSTQSAQLSSTFGLPTPVSSTASVSPIVSVSSTVSVSPTTPQDGFFPLETQIIAVPTSQGEFGIFPLLTVPTQGGLLPVPLSETSTLHHIQDLDDLDNSIGYGFDADRHNGFDDSLQNGFDNGIGYGINNSIRVKNENKTVNRFENGSEEEEEEEEGQDERHLTRQPQLSTAIFQEKTSMKEIGTAVTEKTSLMKVIGTSVTETIETTEINKLTKVPIVGIKQYAEYTYTPDPLYADCLFDTTATIENDRFNQNYRQNYQIHRQTDQNDHFSSDSEKDPSNSKKDQKSEEFSHNKDQISENFTLFAKDLIVIPRNARITQISLIPDDTTAEIYPFFTGKRAVGEAVVGPLRGNTVATGSSIPRVGSLNHLPIIDKNCQNKLQTSKRIQIFNFFSLFFQEFKKDPLKMIVIVLALANIIATLAFIYSATFSNGSGRGSSSSSVGHGNSSAGRTGIVIQTSDNQLPYSFPLSLPLSALAIYQPPSSSPSLSQYISSTSPSSISSPPSTSPSSLSPPRSTHISSLLSPSIHYSLNTLPYIHSHANIDPYILTSNRIKPSLLPSNDIKPSLLPPNDINQSLLPSNNGDQFTTGSTSIHPPSTINNSISTPSSISPDMASPSSQSPSIFSSSDGKTPDTHTILMVFGQNPILIIFSLFFALFSILTIFAVLSFVTMSLSAFSQGGFPYSLYRDTR